MFTPHDDHLKFHSHSHCGKHAHDYRETIDNGDGIEMAVVIPP